MNATPSNAPVSRELRDVPEPPIDRATDASGVLPLDLRQAIADRLANFERQTGAQVLVYINRRVPDGIALEDYTRRRFNEWRVGQYEKSNGVVLFIFTEDRKLRLEVGSGLEDVLDNATSQRIIDTVIIPRLLMNDYPGGVVAGVDSILEAVRHSPSSTQVPGAR